MRQWDIYLLPFPSLQQPHPFVIISNNGICQNAAIDSVNALACQTVRPANRAKKANEVYLNSADGLEWKTLVKCDFIHAFKKSAVLAKRGEVSPARIGEIRQKLREFF
jgi:mRNA-degrading endonuclease toxin of MazEF toxin-antitoxin module